MRRARFAFRVFSRLAVIAIVGAFITVVGLQYARIIGKNSALASRLATVQSDVITLAAKRNENERHIRRLSDPAGAIPEIHDKLHLVRDREAIIYLEAHGARR